MARPIITRNHLASKPSKDFNENRLCIHNVLLLGFIGQQEKNKEFDLVEDVGLEPTAVRL